MDGCSLPFRLSIRRHTRTVEKDVITEARGWSDALVLADFDDSIYDVLGAACWIRSPRLLCRDISLLSVFTHDRVSLIFSLKFQIEAYFLFLQLEEVAFVFSALVFIQIRFDPNIYYTL